MSSSASEPSADPGLGRSPIVTAVAVESALGVVALGLGFVFGVPAAATLRFSLADIGIGLLATAPMLAFFAAFMAIDVAAFRSIRRLLDTFTATVFGRATWPQVAIVAAAAGVGEELLFRGFLQAALEPALGPVAALALASVAFGLAHAVTAAYVVIATVFGAYLGWLWLATGNLLTVVTAHAAYDFAALAVMISARRRRP